VWSLVAGQLPVTLRSLSYRRLGRVLSTMRATSKAGSALVALVGLLACCAEAVLIYGVTRPAAGDTGAPRVSSSQYTFAVVLAVLLVMTVFVTLKNARRLSE
jgi:hypothetical protein